MKKFYIISLCILSFCIIFMYCSLVFFIPNLINSQKFVNNLTNYISKKSERNIKIENLNLIISPILNAKLTIKEAKINKDKKTDLEISDLNINADLKRLKVKELNAKYINIDLDFVSKSFPKKKTPKDKKLSFDIKKLPNLNIQRLILSKKENVEFNIDFENLEIKENENEKNINLNATAKLDRVNNSIHLGKTGKLFIKDNVLYADNYSIIIGENSAFCLNGTILKDKKLDNFTIEGKDIPFKTTMESILFLQKFTDPTKKFIENFKDFDGKIYAKGEYKNDKMTAYLKLTNVKAKTVLCNIPLKVPEAEFFMENNEINSFVTGFMGKEVITHKLHMVNLSSKDRIAYGEVRTKVTSSIVKSYFPKEFKLANYIDLNINYNIQHRKVDVKYKGYFPKTTNIYFKQFYSGIKDKEKIITVETYKDGKNLYLKDYKYYVKENGKYKDILVGDGLLYNINGKMYPQYLNFKTNGYVPNSFMGSFGNYVIGGKFNGALTYDYNKEQLLGEFEVIDTIFNDFYAKSAKVVANEKLMAVTSTGTYRNQKYSCYSTSDNHFKDKIHVYNMDLFLDKYIVKKSAKEKIPKNIDIKKTSKKVSSQVRKVNMDIDKWQVKGNLIQIGNIKLHDIKLNGYLKDSIFQYNIPKLQYANGIITAKGMYNNNIDSSIIDFSAKNIDSSIVAEDFFGMKNQIEGIANATLHSETSKDLNNVKVNATFEINNGALPQLENMEIDTGKKNAKVSDYIKFGAIKKGTVKSRLTGSFKCDEYKIYDADVRLQQEFVSLLITGNYNYKNGDEEVYMFGKYDNDIAKKTKIINIPLNWLINMLVFSENSFEKYSTEISKIPPIGISDKQAKFFIASVTGNPNKKKINVKIKQIRK